MKKLKLFLLPAAIALLAVCSSIAQPYVVDSYGIAYALDYTQTTANSSSQNTNPYSFSAFVEGPSLNPTNPYFFNHSGTAPGQTISPSGIYRNFEAVGYSSFGAMTTAYTDTFGLRIWHGNLIGDYTDVAALALGTNSSNFPTSPVISGGTWSNNKLQVVAGSNYTLNFNSYGTGGIGWNNVELYVDFTPGIGGTFDAQSVPNVATSSFLIPANELTAGNTYDVELIFINRVDVDNGASISGAFGFAAYATALSFQIEAVSAIPEPSTYAAFAGLGALGLAAWRRRRTTAA